MACGKNAATGRTHEVIGMQALHTGETLFFGNPVAQKHKYVKPNKATFVNNKYYQVFPSSSLSVQEMSALWGQVKT